MPDRHPNPNDLLALLRGVARSFFVSIRVLPRALRQPIAVAYLLARAADTVADTAQLPSAERLDLLRGLGDAIASDHADPALIRYLGTPVAACVADSDESALLAALPLCLGALEELEASDRDPIREVLHSIVRGQALDLERFGSPGEPAALETVADLHEYTYLVAGCVGEFWTNLASRHLPGFARLPIPEMHALGRSYGMGLQLVNILRDVDADLTAGRCYFPLEQLRAAGLAPPDVLRRPDAFRAIRDGWLDRADAGMRDGMRYALAVNSPRVRVASALPALIGTRTITLLRRAAGPRVKVPRSEVRSLLAGLALSLGSRGHLERAFARVHDNSRP
jgi:farnesyl-diphosphate farnesyltransferase